MHILLNCRINNYISRKFKIMFLKKFQPRSNTTKKAVVTAGFYALGRVLESASKVDDSMKNDVAEWDEGYCFYMKVLPSGPSLAMQKTGKYLKFLGMKELESANMVVEVKNMEIAFKMITAQLGAHHVYAQHQIGVVGSVADSMRFIRMVYTAEDYLFPKILSKNILKKVKNASLDKALNRLHILTFGLFLGK